MDGVMLPIWLRERPGSARDLGVVRYDSEEVANPKRMVDVLAPGFAGAGTGV